MQRAWAVFHAKAALHMPFSYSRHIACAPTNQNWSFSLCGVCVNVSFRQIITDEMHATHSKFKHKTLTQSMYERISNWIQPKAIFATDIFFSLSFVLCGFNFLALSQLHRVLSQVSHNDCIAVYLTKTWEDSKWTGRTRQSGVEEREKKQPLDWQFNVHS